MVLPPRLEKYTLQLAVGSVVLALPNLQVYYWATILVMVRWWFTRSRAKAAVCLEAAIVGSLTKLANLVYRGPRAYEFLPYPTRITLRVLAVARKQFLQPHQWSP